LLPFSYELRAHVTKDAFARQRQLDAGDAERLVQSVEVIIAAQNGPVVLVAGAPPHAQQVLLQADTHTVTFAACMKSSTIIDFSLGSAALPPRDLATVCPATSWTAVISQLSAWVSSIGNFRSYLLAKTAIGLLWIHFPLHSASCAAAESVCMCGPGLHPFPQGSEWIGLCTEYLEFLVIL